MKMSITRFVLLLGLVVLAAAGGCRTTGDSDQAPPGPGKAAGDDSGPCAAEHEPRGMSFREHRFVAGFSVENRPIEIRVIGVGYDVVFILSSIHGDESGGGPLVARLAAYLLDHPEIIEGRQVVLLPEANPDGVAAGTRENARGVDLNRNFTAANRRNNAKYGHAALSEPEAALIDAIIRAYSPDRIVTLHQPIACIDYDGAGRELAARMSDLSGLPVRKLGTRPGSLGAFAGVTLGIPIITVELPGKADDLDTERLFDRFGMMLVAAVVYPDQVDPATD